MNETVTRIASLVVALSCVGCTGQMGPSDGDDDAGGGTGKPTAHVRVLHLSPDAPAVDAFLGSARVASGLKFTESTGALAPAPGKGTLAVSAAGSPVGSAVATLPDVLLEADHDYTAFAFGKLANLQINVAENDTQGLASNNVRLRVTHAADGVGTVNVYQVPTTGAAVPIAQNLRFGTSAAPVDLPSAAFVVGLDIDADGKSDLLFPIPALQKGTVVNAFAVLDASGAPFILAQLGGSTTVRIDAQTTQLRVLHLSPNAPAVEAFVDGTLPGGFGQVSFSQSTPYVSIAATTHEIEVSASGTAADAVLKVPGLQFAAGQKYTAVALGQVSALKAVFFENGSTGLAAGNIRVRAIHAAPSVGNVNLFSGAGGSETFAPLLSAVKFGDVSAPLDLPAGAYTIGVDANNDNKPDLYFELPALMAGTVANVFVTQDASGTVFALAQLDGTTTARIDKAMSKLRVVHLSRNAPAVDVYANGAKAISSLAYGSTTAILPVPSGAYDLAVTAAGANISTAVINTTGTLLLPGKAYTVVAYADLPGIKAEILEDNLDGINTNTDIRLNVIHVAPTVTRGDIFAVKPSGNVRLVSDIGFGEARSIPDLASSAYTIGFDAESNGTIDLAFNLPVLAPGSFANIFVATDASNQVYVLVQTTGAGAIRVNPNP